jgi:hypothetical protein
VKLRSLPVRTACATALIFVAAVPGSTIATAANAAQHDPPFCSGTAAIPASDLASPVAISHCPIEGRSVVMDLGPGRPEGGVYVQPPGKGQTVIVTTTGGESELTVLTDTRGNVTAKQSFADAPGSSAPEIPATDAACSEGAWNAEGGIWYSLTRHRRFCSTTTSPQQAVQGSRDRRPWAI